MHRGLLQGFFKGGVGLFSGILFPSPYTSLVAFAGGRWGGVTPFAAMIRRISAMVSGAGLKLPTRYPSAIRRGVQPQWFARFQVLMSAPWAARKAATLGAFR